MTGGRSPHRKGDLFERACRDYLRTCGLVVDRAYGAGRPDDAGDLILFDRLDLLLECKAHNDLDLGPWLRQARAKAEPHRTPIVLAKRRQAQIRDAFAITDLRGLTHLLRSLL